jgi:putative acetyltransferase
VSNGVNPQKSTVHIRRIKPGEEMALFDVHYSAIHQVASRDYSPEQLEAWAPRDIDPELWARRIRDINPFVVELGGHVVAYADLQSNGYIDHFFVSGAHPGRGIGMILMTHILDEAKRLGLTELTSDVSRTAQGFYERFGFQVVEQRKPIRRGVEIPNALMRLEMK